MQERWNDNMKVVIVGGVAGGATAAARIRRLNEQAEIVVFERSGYISYAALRRLPALPLLAAVPPIPALGAGPGIHDGEAARPVYPRRALL